MGASGDVLDPESSGILDTYLSKRHMISTAPVIANQLLLVDEILRAGRKKGDSHHRSRCPLTCTGYFRERQDAAVMVAFAHECTGTHTTSCDGARGLFDCWEKWQLEEQRNRP